jgi:sialidase-1
MTVRLSYDECRTWSVSKVIFEGPSSYSDLCVAPDGIICCLFEKGQERGVSVYSGDITFARFDLEWLTDGEDSLES